MTIAQTVDDHDVTGTLAAGQVRHARRPLPPLPGLRRAARLNRYHHQVVDRLAGIAPNDPATAEARAKALALKERLNRARIAMAAVPVRRLQLDELAQVDRLDLERMVQDLDRMAERMNTVRLQIEAFLSGTGRADPKAEQFHTLAARQNTARVAVLATREAARAYAPADYRLDEILF